MSVRLAVKNRERHPEEFQRVYESEVEKRIRLRYTVSRELAILRQRDTKPDEFAEYNAYAELCKREVKEMIGGIRNGEV